MNCDHRIVCTPWINMVMWQIVWGTTLLCVCLQWRHHPHCHTSLSSSLMVPDQVKVWLLGKSKSTFLDGSHHRCELEGWNVSGTQLVLLPSECCWFSPVAVSELSVEGPCNSVTLSQEAHQQHSLHIPENRGISLPADYTYLAQNRAADWVFLLFLLFFGLCLGQGFIHEYTMLKTCLYDACHLTYRYIGLQWTTAKTQSRDIPKIVLDLVHGLCPFFFI